MPPPLTDAAPPGGSQGPVSRGLESSRAPRTVSFGSWGAGFIPLVDP